MRAVLFFQDMSEIEAVVQYCEDNRIPYSTLSGGNLYAVIDDFHQERIDFIFSTIPLPLRNFNREEVFATDMYRSKFPISHREAEDVSFLISQLPSYGYKP